MFRSPVQSGPEPCRPATVVLDFDGTLTDADAHAPAFHEASGRELASLLGWDEPTLRREWRRAQGAVARLPADAAWVVDGCGVCPAAADPYLVANGVARLLLAEHRPGLGEADLMACVLEVHRAAYRRAPPPFRPDARDLLEELRGSGCHVRVVTNSRTEGVEQRLDALSPGGRERIEVRGDAGKFFVGAGVVADPRFAALPDVAVWPGLARPVHLRRGRYFELLRQVWDDTATGPEAMLVVGDVLELDLAMPAVLGAHVHLVTHAGTMPQEVQFVRRMARGDADARLAAVLERIRP